MRNILSTLIISVGIMVGVSSILNAQTSYIQVVSEPGVSVFLDDVLKGKTTSEMGGLIIEGVSPGGRTIKVVKEGFNPQEDKITVKSGEVYTHRVKPFVPSIKISQQGNVGQQQIDLQVGEIKIQSLPVEISLSIPSLGVNSSKTKDEWLAKDIPVGDYEATFKWNNKTLKYIIKVTINQQVHLFVNMIKGEIEDRSSILPREKENNPGTGNRSNVDYGSMTDPRDGKIYKTVHIGKQVWMAENLNVGTMIQGNQKQTNNSTIEKYCYDHNAANCNTYGGLYQWNEAMQYSTTPGIKGICPLGWHIPTLAEFEALQAAVGNDGNALKAIGQGTGSGAETNTSGFSALLAGYRYYNGYFYHLGYVTYFWSSTEYNAYGAYYLYLVYNGSNIDLHYVSKISGFSVRCLKD